MVSALDFRSRGRWFEPGHCRRVVSLDKKLYSTLSLFTQVYKWVRAIIMLGGNLVSGLASHPGGSSNIPNRFMLRTPELSAGLKGHLTRKRTLPPVSLSNNIYKTCLILGKRFDATIPSLCQGPKAIRER